MSILEILDPHPDGFLFVNLTRLLTRLDIVRFLMFIPCSSLGMDNCLLRIAIALRLGLPVSKEYKCICGSIAVACGSHARALVRKLLAAMLVIAQSMI